MSDKLRGFQFNGVFALEFLERTEVVRKWNNPPGCQIAIGDFSKTWEVAIGDVVCRLPDGDIAVVVLVPDWSDKEGEQK